MKNKKDMKFDTSRRVAQIMPNGAVVLIQGKGLHSVGAVKEIDLTDTSPEDFKRLSDNPNAIKISEKGDRITLKPKDGKAITGKGTKINGT